MGKGDEYKGNVHSLHADDHAHLIQTLASMAAHLLDKGIDRNE